MKNLSVQSESVIFDNAKRIKANLLGMSIIAATKKINVVKEKTTAKEFEKTFGIEWTKVRKINFAKNVRAYNYKKNVDKKATNGKEIEQEKMKGFEWLSGWENVVKISNASGEKNISITYTDEDKSICQSRYVVGDRFATDNELQFIIAHLRTKPTSQKQSALGIAEEQQIKFGTYEFGNIFAIGTNDKVEPIWTMFCE